MAVEFLHIRRLGQIKRTGFGEGGALERVDVFPAVDSREALRDVGRGDTFGRETLSDFHHPPACEAGFVAGVGAGEARIIEKFLFLQRGENPFDGVGCESGAPHLLAKIGGALLRARAEIGHAQTHGLLADRAFPFFLLIHYFIVGVGVCQSGAVAVRNLLRRLMSVARRMSL